MRQIPTRTLIILSATALLVAIAGPATAKKPVPAPEPTAYEVSLSFYDNETPGLSTSCSDKGPVTIRMFGNRGPGTLSLWDTDTPDEAPLIHVRAPELDWERTYPVASEGFGFDECHGPSVFDGPEHPFADYGGALGITIDYDEGTVDFLWHFDYYIDGEDLGVKKPRWVSTVREHYTVSATASFDQNTEIVHGSFPVSWSLKEGRIVVHGYDPFPPIDGTDMMFYMEVTPLD